MSGGGDGLDFGGGGGLGGGGGGGGGDIGGGGGFPGGDTGMGMGPGDLGNITGMGFGGPGGFDPTSGYPSGDQTGGGGLPPETATNITAPQAQAPAPGTTSTSIGGTQTGTPGPTGGQQPAAPPAQQPQQAPQASQLQQLIQQIMKAASPGQAHAAPAGPSNISPSLAQLSQQSQQPAVPGGNGADSTVIVPNAEQGDILTGSQHEGGFGLAPEVEQQPRPPGTPQEGLGVPETGPGGGLGDLARQAPSTGLPATDADRSGRFSDLGLDPSQEQPRPPRTPQEAGSQAPTEEQPRPPLTPQEAGSQQQPDVPLPTPRPAGAPQAQPSTPQTPAAPGQAQQGFPGGAMNPMKFIGDILQLMGGNPMPLLSDLANQFGMGGGPSAGQQPWQGKQWQPGYDPKTGMYTDPKTGQKTQMQRAQEDAQQQPQAQQPQQPQTEEQRQRQQRQQDLGQPGTYVIDDKGQRVRVQTDAKGNPQYDKKGQPIPAPEQQAPGTTKQGGPLPPPWPQGRPPDYFQHHGERPGANLVRINTPYGPVTANKAAAQDFLNLTNEMKQAGVPGIDKFGSFNIRQKRYGSGYSSHSYGAAFDMNNEAGPMNPQLQNWIKQNPQQWQDMLRRNNFSQYMVQHDPNHLEWTGPRGTQTAAYPPQPLPAGQNRPPANVGGTVGPNDPYTKQLVNLESSGKRFAKTGSNYGLGQFSPDQFRHFGITDPYNPQQQYRAIAQERAENIPVARKILGREPTASELYLMHQQGQTGGANLLRAAQNNPNGPAWQTVRERGRSDGYAMRKIHGNIPSDNPLSRVPANQVTNAQFKQMWDDRFNRGGGGSRTAQTPQTPQTPQQPRIRGLDLLPGGRTAQSDGGPPIQLASLSQSTEGPQDQSRGGGEDKPYDEPPRLPMMPPYPHNDQNLPLPGNPAGWQDYGIPGAVID